MTETAYRVRAASELSGEASLTSFHAGGRHHLDEAAVEAFESDGVVSEEEQDNLALFEQLLR